MPKLSKRSVTGQELGPGKEWAGDLDGYRVSLVETTADADLTPLLQGLPNDQCPCPHWGYVVKVRMWFRFGEREEVYEAGEAFYAPAGHTSGAAAGSEFVIFRPRDLMAEVETHMMQRAQQLRGKASADR